MSNMDRTQAALTKDEKKNQKESADRTNKIRWRKSFEDAFFSRRSRRIEKQTNDERNSEEKMQKNKEFSGKHCYKVYRNARTFPGVGALKFKLCYIARGKYKF